MDLFTFINMEISNTHPLIIMIGFYVDNIIGLKELEDWYVPKLEELVDNPNTADIVAQLELGLAELQDGLITEDELKNDLRDVIKNA